MFVVNLSIVFKSSSGHHSIEQSIHDFFHILSFIFRCTGHGFLDRFLKHRSVFTERRQYCILLLRLIFLFDISYTLEYTPIIIKCNFFSIRKNSRDLSQVSRDHLVDGLMCNTIKCDGPLVVISLVDMGTHILLHTKDLTDRRYERICCTSPV